MTPRTLAAGALFVALLPALGWLPYRVAVPPGTASASAVVGYHNGFAFLILAALCAIGLAAMIALSRYEVADFPAPFPLDRGKIQVRELTLIVVAIAVLYFPLALVRYAPYVEDDYWLTLLHRMEGGLRPYADFESLYGPLMIMAPRAWLAITGYSALAYTTFIMLAEVALFAFLAILFQRLVPDHRRRRFLLLVLAVLLANTLIGLSWNGWRRFAPALILLLFARGPRDDRTVVLSALATGVLLAYSHDFGILTLVALLALHVYLLVWEGRTEAIRHSILLFLVALSSWLLLSLALLGPDVGSYAKNAIYGAARFAAEASFPFWWTLNSLAAFALLVLLLHAVAPGLARRKGPAASSADLMLLGGIAYALPALKSGLNRADMWHVAAPLLPALVALLLPWPRQRFLVSPSASRLANALILIFVSTYALALLPTGSLVLRGLARGTIDILQTVPRDPRVELRGPSIEGERSHPREDILAAGAFLARPELRDLPVLLYGNAWDMDKRMGVFRIGYPTDDFLLSDDSGRELQALLARTPQALVVIRARPYQRLLDGSDRFETLLPETVTSRVLGVLSTIHYTGAQLEYEQKERRWARTVGRWLVEHSTKIAEHGDLVILQVGS